MKYYDENVVLSHLLYYVGDVASRLGNLCLFGCAPSVAGPLWALYQWAMAESTRYDPYALVWNE